jgi:murein DD-endopeptidase MepM/ murein hydrolase activator NlpD
MSAHIRSYRGTVQIALAGAAIALLGGCATDSTRFADPVFSNPFSSLSNPFQSASHDVDRAPTGAIPDDMPARSGGVRSGPIQSAPLPAPGAPASAPAPQRVGATPASPQHVGAAPSGGVAGNWSAQGGTPITVRYGETPSMLAGRYGVPVDALLRVNGLTSPAQVKQGAKLVVPVYSANAAAPAGSAKPQVAVLQGKPAAPAKMASPQPKLVTAKGPAGKITKVQPAPAKVEAVKTKPGKTAQIATPAAPKPAQSAPAKVAKIEAAPVTKVQQTPIKAAVDPQPTASLPPKTDAAAAPTADANPEFRWPARGRIIQGFKSGGNDGINISVPEGTAVKAAENGVVAYAGSELKGYGNLVLIRHPNGFVSAYANNGAIEVKRGDTVKRGQTIAKSGQTGNVATPQLHFELRKGSTPVDPTNYLAGL